jgi:hypothetical protein
MTELKPGIISNEELAEWFGVKETTFRNKKKKKLEELKEYCDFEILPGGKINITYVEAAGLTYEKKGSKSKELLRERVKEESLKPKSHCSKPIDVYEGIQNDLEFRKKLTIKPSTTKTYVYVLYCELWGKTQTYRKPGTEGTLGRRKRVLCSFNEEIYEWEPVSDEDLEFFYSCKKEMTKEQMLNRTKLQFDVAADVREGSITKEEADRELSELTQILIAYEYAIEQLSKKLGRRVDWAMKCERTAWEAMKRGEFDWGS